MNNEFKKGIEELRGIKLSQNEKDEMFSAISTYADKAPTAPTRSNPSPFFSFFSLKNASAFASILILLGTATASYAAEGALPGDPLYAIKVNLNEPLRGAFAISKSAKASWEEKKLDRRLMEAEKLASKGKLSEAAIIEVEKRIDQHVDKHDEIKIKEKKEEAKKTENTAFPSRTQPKDDDSMEVKIKEHKAILEDIKTDKDEKEREKIERLEKKLEEKSKNRKNADSRSDESNKGSDKNNK
jgi:hypothetical protein